jgi:hypothetical protein
MIRLFFPYGFGLYCSGFFGWLRCEASPLIPLSLLPYRLLGLGLYDFSLWRLNSSSLLVKVCPTRGGILL